MATQAAARGRLLAWRSMNVRSSPVVRLTIGSSCSRVERMALRAALDMCAQVGPPKEAGGGDPSESFDANWFNETGSPPLARVLKKNWEPPEF